MGLWFEVQCGCGAVETSFTLRDARCQQDAAAWDQRRTVEAVVDKPDVARPARRDGAVRLEKRLGATTRLAVIVEETATSSVS